MVKIICMRPTYLRQTSMVRQENRTSILHGLQYRQPESLCDRREKECLAMPQIPVLFFLADWAQDMDTFRHSPAACLGKNPLHLGRRSACQIKMEVVSLQQAGKHMEVLFGKDGSYGKEERCRRWRLRRTDGAFVCVTSIIYYIYRTISYVKVLQKLATRIVRNGHQVSYLPQRTFQPTAICSPLVLGKRLIQVIQVMNRLQDRNTRRKVVGKLICRMP